LDIDSVEDVFGMALGHRSKHVAATGSDLEDPKRTPGGNALALDGRPEPARRSGHPIDPGQPVERLAMKGGVEPGRVHPFRLPVTPFEPPLRPPVLLTRFRISARIPGTRLGNPRVPGPERSAVRADFHLDSLLRVEET
jgi:hypothetical protein